jgi:TonB-dependent starch-binding outer membrane protein SusC
MELSKMGYRILLSALLISAVSLQVLAKENGTGITLSKKNAALSEIFLSVYQQSGFFFLYKDEILRDARKVTIEVKDASIQDVLRICFSEQPFTYAISDHVIIVTRKSDSSKETDPTFWIEGKVVNEKDQPLEGADIEVKGTFRGTQSDARGNFKIRLNPDRLNLEISYTGYENKLVKAVSGQFLTVVLKISTSPLDQIQVIAYGSTSKRLNIGDVSTIGAKTIAEQPVTNPLEALEGRAAGLQITQQTGVPGGAFTVLIRGQNSIANGNNPLYVIDGVPFTGTSISSNLVSGGITSGGNPLSSMNPADIESVDILKDADATSIYGSRGANGVILITTKMGKAGKTNVDMNVYAGSGKVTRFMPLLNTTQYLQMRREAFQNDGEVPNSSTDYDLLSWDTTRYTDWQKSLYGGTANLLNAQVSLSGGNQNTRFIIGGSYNRQTTVFPGNFSDQKGTGHVGITHTSNDQRFKINFTALYSGENNFLPSFDNTSQALILPPDAPPVYDSSGKLNWANGTFNNPFAQIERNYTAKTNNLLSNMVLSYELFPHFLVRLNAGYSNLQMNENQINPLSSLNPTYGYPSGFSYFSNQSLETWILEPQLEYRISSKFGGLNFLMGSTFQQNLTNGQTLYATGFSSDYLLKDIGAASSITQEGVNQSEYRYEALFARISYNWQEKYLLNLTARRDGSSRFGPENQFANFGSIAGGWIFSKEKFFEQNVPALSFGKLRTSYGSSGNDQIGDYQYLDSWTPVFYNYQGLSGLQPARLYNPDYGWEVNRKWEAGLELGFLKDRIYVSTSYYRNRSSNQLVGYPLPLITGFSSIQQNLSAVVQNTGWEFVVTTRNISTRNFTWTTNINLTIPQNKLIAYPNLANSPYAYLYVVGKSLNLYPTDQARGVDPKTGLYTFTDVNQDGTITYPEDWLPLKTIEQQYYGGFNNTFQYKNFQAVIFFQFVKQTGRNYLIGNYTAPGMLGNQAAYVLNHWQQSGDQKPIEQYTQDYGSAAYTAYVNQSTSDQGISDASYIRLKNVSVSYQLSSSTLARMHLQLVRFYIQGQNLLTITHFMGVDPENQSITSLPPLKIWTGGIQITL